ncbi:hypothetical protein CDAR_13511 [Caerostris darwini]|uniref:Uncharacterized protein n=1 Tax=Caerostris darwini TaxID=1538125 RepID=A0AAV4UDT8_9ARAC|nr:hypothetical protein CDAR_13511 [Caerostris darwini]
MCVTYWRGKYVIVMTTTTQLSRFNPWIPPPLGVGLREKVGPSKRNDQVQGRVLHLLIARPNESIPKMDSKLTVLPRNGFESDNMVSYS